MIDCLEKREDERGHEEELCTSQDGASTKNEINPKNVSNDKSFLASEEQ
jgi:hypothetical protein